MQVKGLTQLMHTQFYRDRLVHTHFKGTAWEKMFSSWEAGAFIPWRWGSLVNVCKGLWRRKGPLTTMWSSIKFTCSNTWSGASASSGMLNKASEAIASSWFWAYLDFILLCAGALEELSSWCEGCPCHGHERPGCPFKGRRAPELSTGRFRIFLKDQCSLVSAMFMAASAALDDHSRGVLMQEWQTAMQVITTTLRVKTANWKALPWILAGVASNDEDLARVAGSRALALFDSESFGFKHPLSQKFLSKHGPLRQNVEDFLGGAPRAPMNELCSHLGALALIRIVERETEGMHKDIKSVISRSPNASLAYVSTELRAKLFIDLLSQPAALEFAAEKFHYLNQSLQLSNTAAFLAAGPGVESLICFGMF